MSRKNNLILTYASGEAVESQTFAVFLNSYIQYVPDADLVVLTHDMSKKMRDLLNQFNVQIVDVQAGEMYYLFRDRHLHFWNYVNQYGSYYSHVLITDSRDVLFQSNPFDWVEKWKENRSEFVILMAEGFKRSSCGFACIEHFEFQRDVPMPHLKDDNNRLVCNAGVTIGTPRSLQHFEMLMFMTTMKTIGRCTDQASLNYLLYFIDKDPCYYISHPETDALCLTGEGVKINAVDAVFSDGKFYNKNNELYCLVHQWDRLKGMSDDILKNYFQ